MVEKLWQKAKEFIGLEEGREISAEGKENEVVIKLKNNENRAEGEYEIVVYEPRVYEDSLSISTKLRQGNPVIINLKNLDPTEGTRLIDFVCGTAYAIDGHMIKIGESIFLFAPQNVLITDMEEKTSLKDETESEERSFFGRK